MAQDTTYRLAETVQVPHLADVLLQKYVEDNYNGMMILDDWELTTIGEPIEMSEVNTTEKIRYAELQRPRVLLSFFVDLFRVTTEVATTCRSSCNHDF